MLDGCQDNIYTLVVLIKETDTHVLEVDTLHMGMGNMHVHTHKRDGLIENA